MIEIYTDGSGKWEGPIGWAFVIVSKGYAQVYMCGREEMGTNNTAELTAVMKALEFAVDLDMKEITIKSDSAYVVNAFNDRWLHKWQANGWRTGNKKKPVKNQELWKKLVDLVQHIEVEWVHVPAHSGIKYNELADKLAGNARKEIPLEGDIRCLNG